MKKPPQPCKLPRLTYGEAHAIAKTAQDYYVCTRCGYWHTKQEAAK